MYNNGVAPTTAIPEPKPPSQTVDRALSILTLLAQRGPSGVTEVANALGVHKSTTARLLATLERFRFVEQDGNRGKYRLGFGIVRLAGATAAQLDIAKEGRPVCARLAAELRGTVSLSVLEGGGATAVAQEPSTERNWIGLRMPLHATATGKVLLASLGFEELSGALERPRQRFTADTITASGALLADLNRVRDRGWAATIGELETGLNSVAVPVRGPGGRIAGALSVSAYDEHLQPDDFKDLARILKQASEEILARLELLANP
ncbi:IclR family transcriptional regulator [Prauserella sp. PE36]|uniref:IclR family transcriptional regulator n=1 Tax=Prauserella endophytica TaxID=1592324 RepID=A0ABY2S448_9PSEU|nr:MULTISPECIES: IclR family transcriptional regulator [Prauserella]PXY23344.1 transcriptional regulator [Prauserella coralliicola]RBM18306.1 IclR family transcriptional regulator [Prauserella sp. PE36]TKG70567.1 IclR family transcriptional regulator [Prauserella endophytica]